MIRKYIYGRFTLVLDSAQLSTAESDNYCEGAPELLIYTAPNGRTAERTYYCALDTGTYTDEKGFDCEFTKGEYLWLESMQENIDSFYKDINNGK
jgi:hypothetical protein